MNSIHNLKIGDRLVRSKGLFSTHHGIFVGFHNGNYMVAENNTPHGVRYVTYDQFLNGQQLIRVEPFNGSEYRRSQIIPFINSKVGTSYNLINYNCEHFASDVQTGKPVSYQVVTAGVLGLALAFYASMRD